MMLTGTINKGRVDLAEPVGLPDGTEVTVEVISIPVAGEDKSAEQSLHDQQVKPVSNLTDLVGAGPTNDSLDEFLDGVRKGRR